MVPGGVPAINQTYATPSLTQRRNKPAATWAYFALVIARFVQIYPGMDQDTVVPCMTCGANGNMDWCNQCELENNRPPQARGLWTPKCTACVQDNIQCRICGVRPSDGPAEEDMPWHLNVAQAGGAL